MAKTFLVCVIAHEKLERHFGKITSIVKSKKRGSFGAKSPVFEVKIGAPGGTRTHDPLLRRQMQSSSKNAKKWHFFHDFSTICA